MSLHRFSACHHYSSRPTAHTIINYNMLYINYSSAQCFHFCVLIWLFYYLVKIIDIKYFQDGGHLEFSKFSIYVTWPGFAFKYAYCFQRPHKSDCMTLRYSGKAFTTWCPLSTLDFFVTLSYFMRELGLWYVYNIVSWLIYCFLMCFALKLHNLFCLFCPFV